MLFRATVIALLASVASAASFATPNGDVPVDSALGQRMLAKATVVEPARHLNEERDVTFIAKYSLRYLGCASLIQIAEEGNQDGGMLRTQHLVRFALCPSGSCSTCKNGGEYVVNMLEFVDAYTEAKLNEKEYTCEMIRENCYCDNANDDEVCENQCYTNEGHDECIEYEGEEEFEIQRYLECQEMEMNNNNNNNNYQAYYVGPYCASDGKSIKLGVFYDETCTAKAENGLEAYKTNNYGVALPFSDVSIIASGECMDCKAVDENANNNNNNNNNNGNGYYYQEELEVTELCEQSYEMAARCEEKMEISYKDTSGCDYINNILPRLESASRSISTGESEGKAAKAFAGVFAFTTVLFAAYAYFLYRKIKRGSVDLSAQE